jgi:hypothetical protein
VSINTDRDSGRVLTDEELRNPLEILRWYQVCWVKKRLRALAGPSHVEALALTGDRKVLEDVEVLGGRNRGAVESGEGLDGVLDARLASGLEHPADLDRSVIVAHERGGKRRGIFAGGWSKQGCDEIPEEVVVVGPCIIRVG